MRYVPNKMTRLKGTASMGYVPNKMTQLNG